MFCMAQALGISVMTLALWVSLGLVSPAAFPPTLYVVESFSPHHLQTPVWSNSPAGLDHGCASVPFSLSAPSSPGFHHPGYSPVQGLTFASGHQWAAAGLCGPLSGHTSAYLPACLGFSTSKLAILHNSAWGSGLGFTVTYLAG